MGTFGLNPDIRVNLHMTCDWVGNLVTRGSETYSYDELERLTHAVVGGMSHSYTYDAWGNMLRMERDRTPAFDYSSPGYADNRVPGWTYDPEGRLLDDGSYSYLWSPRGYLTQLASAETKERYRYDLTLRKAPYQPIHRTSEANHPVRTA